MGRYLDIARKFEARQNKEIADSRVDYRAQYQQAAEEIREECFLVDGNWLINSHPAIWACLVKLDQELTSLEQQGAVETLYQHTLTQLVEVIKKAREMQEREQRHRERFKQ
jgi:hypothetical protein